MAELLTTKHVQDLLKIDRTTVYRMINDGRLKGIKVGHQWRFNLKEVEEMLQEIPAHEPDIISDLSQDLPIHCMQALQNVFAEIAGIGVLITDAEGNVITEFSNACSFCKLILESPEGKKACINTWKKLSQDKNTETKIVTCHAGLQYISTPLELNGQRKAILIAGQFLQTEALGSHLKQIPKTAAKYSLDKKALQYATQDIPVLKKDKQDQLPGWVSRVGQAFIEMASERANLIYRLRDISKLSDIDKKF